MYTEQRPSLFSEYILRSATAPYVAICLVWCLYCCDLPRLRWEYNACLYVLCLGTDKIFMKQERARVSALKRLGIDYTCQEPSLDFITKLITNVCACNSASICLIDAKNCHVKSTSGGPSQIKSFDRRLSLSMHCLVPLKPEVLVVEDLILDAR